MANFASTLHGSITKSQIPEPSSFDWTFSYLQGDLPGEWVQIQKTMFIFPNSGDVYAV